MRKPIRDEFFRLLPAVYKKGDAEQGGPLQAVLETIGEQAELIEGNIQQLYEDSFAETASSWAVPYIGELVGVNPSMAGPATGALRGHSNREVKRLRLIAPRRQVVDAARHYRRKGTLAVLEQLSLSAAGWPARAVEFWTSTATTWSQRLAEARPGSVRASDADLIQRVDTAFDASVHLLDPRNPQATYAIQGRHHIRNVGLFVWRIPAYSMTAAIAKCYRPCHHGEDSIWIYAFDPLGHTQQLFIRPVAESSADAIATESNVPGPLRMELLSDPQNPSQAHGEFYGEEKSLAIWIQDFPGAHQDGFIPRNLIDPTDLTPFKRQACSDIDPPEMKDKRDSLISKLASEHHRVLVDPVNGLLAVAHRPAKVWSTYHYGFSADVGGGEYRRAERYQDLQGAVRSRIYCRRDVAQPCAIEQQWTTQFEKFTLHEADLLEEPGQDRRCLEFRIDATRESGRLSGTAPPHAKIDIALSVPQAGAVDYTAIASETGNWQIPSLDPPLTAAAQATARITSSGQTTTARYRFRLQTCEMPLNRVTLVELADSNAHPLNAPRILINRGQTLELRARHGSRPTILTESDACLSGLTFSLAPGSRLVIEGIRFSGGRLRMEHWQGVDTSSNGDCSCQTAVASDTPPLVAIQHSTIRAGHCDCGPGALELDLPSSLVNIQSSILGTISQSNEEPYQPHSTVGATRVALSDSIIDGAGGPAIDGSFDLDLRLERCTILGDVDARSIDLAQDSIFVADVRVQRPQLGGMRFCYVRPDAATPPRYYCQPDLAISRRSAQRQHCNDRTSAPGDDQLGDAIDVQSHESSNQSATSAEDIRPLFYSTSAEHASYARLAHNCPPEIRQGAEDESEMGVFHDLYEPQREANLRERLQQFIPASMHAEILFAQQ